MEEGRVVGALNELEVVYLQTTNINEVNGGKEIFSKNHKGLVFCIPTYNRSLVIEEFLEQYASLFYQLKISICIYDSSDDGKTEVFVKRWMELFDNICYTHIPSEWHANHKVIYIYKHFAEIKTYDYVWVCGDSVRFSKRVIKYIIGVLDSGYDMMIVNGTDEEQIGTREYTNGNELFRDCAWYMTLFGAVIVNVHTILGNVMWPYIQEKYETPDHINYSHIGLYFETICRTGKFRSLYLAVNGEVWESSLKGNAGWYKDSFKFLCEYWPSTMEALPEYYTDKRKSINKLGYYSCLRPLSFLNYRAGDVYNIKSFLKYGKILKDMSRLNTFQLLCLACLNPKIAYFIAANDLKGYVKEIRKVHRLKCFCKNNQKIYIYGAGLMAKRYAEYLQNNGIGYQGFLVTQQDKNPREFQNHPVIALSKFKDLRNEGRIIIGLNQKNIEEVSPVLIEHELWDRSFHEYIMPVMLMDWRRKAKINIKREGEQR